MNADMDQSTMTTEEHRAWSESLTDDEKTVAHVPAGCKEILLVIAYIKRALVTGKMKAGERLHLLEWLNDQVDTFLTPEMLTTIEPMCDTQIAIMREAHSLNDKDDPAGMASFKVLTSQGVFNKFLVLNPSLLAAILEHDHATAGPEKTKSAEDSPAGDTLATGGYGRGGLEADNGNGGTHYD
jgi:hypothetical protein